MNYRLVVRVGAHMYQNQKGEMNFRGDSDGGGISTSHQKRLLLSSHEARQRKYMDLSVLVPFSWIISLMNSYQQISLYKTKAMNFLLQSHNYNISPRYLHPHDGKSKTFKQIRGMVSLVSVSSSTEKKHPYRHTLKPQLQPPAQ